VRDYLDQVHRVAHTDLYYLTLAATLVIPDMCSGLEAPDGKTTAALYQAWFDQHVAAKYTVGPNSTPSFSGEDCYGLRCGMLHQGRLEPHKGAYSRVVFLEPHGNVRMHNNVSQGMLNLDVTRFALDMVESAQQWLVAAEQTAVYQANYPHYMQRYPSGLAPFVKGYPVIA
jgi:hypothetical protein